MLLSAIISGLDLRFSITDSLSLAAICMTAWIAWQTRGLQKRQTELFEKQVKNDLFKMRQEIYQAAVHLGIYLHVGAMPKKEHYDILADGMKVQHCFDMDTYKLTHSLRNLYDRRDALDLKAIAKGDPAILAGIEVIKEEAMGVEKAFADKVKEFMY